MDDDTLHALSEGTIDTWDAYRTLYPVKQRKLKAARFFKISMRIHDQSPGINALIRALLLFPVPARLVRLGIKRSEAKNTAPSLDMEAFEELMRHARGVRIDIITKEASISIKCI